MRTPDFFAMASNGDPVGVISVNSSGCLVQYTPASAKWLGDREPLRVGDVWYGALAEPVRLRLHREWKRCLLDGFAENGQFVSPCKFCFENSDSTHQVVVEFTVPLGDESREGLVIGTVRVCHLPAMPPNDRNAVSVTSIESKLLRTIGHEMQQTMYAIQNFTFAARQYSKMGQSEEVAEMLTKIDRQIVRARAFGDRLRQLATQTQQDARPTDVHQAIDACREILQIYADDARAALQFALRATDTTVLCDPPQLQQVLLNLVRNAADSLIAADSPTRLLAIETANEVDMIRVRVVDSGPGVADDDQQRIFDHFFTTKDSGLGMGLPYCRSVVAAYGGDLKLAENQPGRVAFEVRLPTNA